jgi:L-rhamnono-1,4-lactonase
MIPGHFLQKQHGISDYNTATSASQVQPSGFIFVETDRYLPIPKLDIGEDQITLIGKDEELKKAVSQKLEKWAHEPFEELRFLRRIVEAKPEDGDGFTQEDSGKMVGCVIWAPFHLSTELFELYLQIAEQVAGPRLWPKVVGFRYLVQGISEKQSMFNLVLSKNWLQNVLKLRSGRDGKGWAFDIGIDMHRGGAWQADAATNMIDVIRKLEGDGTNGRVKFILNHLCKPDLSECKVQSDWTAYIRLMARQPEVYMKLSGALNEFEPSPTPAEAVTLAKTVSMFAEESIKVFGSDRVMFGSDWPVCNIGGPLGEEKNWALWRDCVQHITDSYGDEVAEDIWWRTGCKAYGIEL